MGILWWTENSQLYNKMQIFKGMHMYVHVHEPEFKFVCQNLET